MNHIQVGTASPNPSYPQEVKTVTGENTINVTGRNLFDKDSPNILNAYLNNDGTTSANSTFRVSDYINVSGLSDITVSGNNGNSELCCFYDGNKTFISSFGMGTLTTRTVSVPNNAKYLRVTLNSSVLSQYQIENGSTASPYEEYQSQSYPINLGSLELAKISTYKDKIYKNDNDKKWYLRKEIGKTVLNGTENINPISNARFQISMPVYAVGIYIALGYCSHLKCVTQYAIANENLENVFAVNNGQFYGRLTSATTAQDFTNFLVANKPSVYYIASAITETEITNEALIEQLEAVKLLSGTQNNFTIDADTLPTLNLNYIGEANPHL